MESVLYWSIMSVGPVLGWLTECHCIGKNRFSLSQGLLVSNNFLVQAGTSFLIAEFCLVWTCVSLVHVVPVSWVHVCVSHFVSGRCCSFGITTSTGFCRRYAFSLALISEPGEELYDKDVPLGCVLQRLSTLCTSSGCGSLYCLPSALRRSFRVDVEWCSVFKSG